MTEKDTCDCGSEIRYSITTDRYICVGCGKAFSWPIRPPGKELSAPSQVAEPVDLPIEDPKPEEGAQ